MPTLNLTLTDAYADQATIPVNTVVTIYSINEPIEIVSALAGPAATIDGIIINPGTHISINFASSDNVYMRNVNTGNINAQVVVIY